MKQGRQTQEDEASVVPTQYWHRLEDGRVQCDVCPRRCQLQEGQRGLCFVRACQHGAVVLTTYGRSSGFCVDPIEKKPLNHFYPGTPVLSFGTAGCNLTCRFCQNWDISKSREVDTLADRAPPQRIAAACHELGVRAVAVTAGYICEEPRREFYGHLDAANVDLKGFTESFYHRLCSGHLSPVLESLEYLKHETDVWLEITTLLIPGENDSEKEIDALSRWVVDHLGPDVPLHFTAFHPDYKMMDTPATPPGTLTRARDIAMGQGVRYCYTGNVHDEAGQSTYCHACGERVIGRDWYVITAWNLDEGGSCRSCGTRCSGVFEATHGTWGPRRLPVRLAESRAP
jgi:pyruvate formate lyase activating enzyme